MADTYGVTHVEVSKELPGLYPGGFSAATKPSDAIVTGWISRHDTIVTLAVQDATGVAPAAADRAAVLATAYILDAVKAEVMRAAYAGHDPEKVDAAAKPYERSSAAMLQAIERLGLQAVGDGSAADSPVRSAFGASGQRALLITDDHLDAGPCRVRRF